LVFQIENLVKNTKFGQRFMKTFVQLFFENIAFNMNNALLRLKIWINLGGIKRLRCPKPLFVGTKSFIKVATKGDAFFICTLSLPNVESCPHEIPSQY